MNKNITIIGNVAADYHVDTEYKILELIPEFDMSQLSSKLRDLVLRYLHIHISAFIQIENETAKKILGSCLDLVKVLEKYVSQNKENSSEFIFFSHEFYQAVDKIEYEPLYKLLKRKTPNIRLDKGINLIRADTFPSAALSALILPYVLDSIKHLENPILICSQDFIRNSFGHNLTQCGIDNNYKISDRFNRQFIFDCKKAGVLYIEFYGNEWRQI